MLNLARIRWLGLTGIMSASCASSLSSSNRAGLECTLDQTAEVCIVHHPEAKLCDAYKEYVTTYTYLMNKKELGQTKDQLSRTAFSVAKACDGAAGRFIRVFEILMTAGVIVSEATKLAQDLALSNDESSKTFVEVFRFAFLENYLDLPLPEAIGLARIVALNSSRQSALKASEFKKLVEYCLSKEGLGLSRPNCAKFSADLISYDIETKTKSVGSAFIALMEFLREDKDGPQLPSYDAMQIARDVMKVHVEGGKNFIAAFKFARDRNELGLERAQAITFAKDLAALSRAPSPSQPVSKPDPEAKTRDQATGPIVQ